MFVHIFRVYINTISCVMFPVLQASTFRINILTYLLASFHRFLVIVFNKNNLWAYRGSNILLLLACIWIFSIVVSSPLDIKHINVYVLLWRELCSASWRQDQAVAYGFYAGFIGVTVVCTVAFNVSIFMTVRNSSKKVNKKNKKQEIKIAKSLVLLNMYFYVTYVPSVFYAVLKSYPLQSSRIFYLFILYIGTFAIAVNPVIYGLLFPLVGQAYRNHVPCKGQKIAGKIDVSNATTEN